MILRTLRVLAIALFLAVPPATLILAGSTIHDSPQEIESSVEAVLTRVTMVQAVDQQPVRVVLTYESPAVIRAPGWTGLVQKVLVAPGQTVVSGTPIAVIDDVQRIAMRTPLPFSRSLRSGDKGQDVADLQAALTSLGYYAGLIDGVYGADTGLAVKALQGWGLGVRAPSTTFDPTHVIWLPVDSFVVDEVAFDVATPAPAPGTEILSAVRQLWVAALANDAGVPMPQLAEPYVLSIGRESFGIVDGPRLSDDVGERVDEAARDGVIFPREPLEGQADDTTEFDGTIQLSSPRLQAVVPAGAVVGEADSDRQCLFIGSGASFNPLLVSVTSAGLGTVSVDPPPPADAAVLANPLDVLPNATCS